MYEISGSCQIRSLANIYEETFGDKSGGFFVDVGSFDGLYCSNVWGLHLREWRGICFEPVPEYYLQCLERYKDYDRIVCRQVAIGKQNGEMWIEVAGAASSGSPKQLKIMHTSFLNAGFTGGKILTPVHTLEYELASWKVPRKFDILSIDVEGMEMDVLFGFDVPHWKPSLVIIETQSGHPIPRMRNNFETIDDYITSFNYERIYHDAINSIYRSIRHDSLDYRK